MESKITGGKEVKEPRGQSLGRIISLDAEITEKFRTNVQWEYLSLEVKSSRNRSGGDRGALDVCNK